MASLLGVVMGSDDRQELGFSKLPVKIGEVAAASLSAQATGSNFFVVASRRPSAVPERSHLGCDQRHSRGPDIARWDPCVGAFGAL